MGRATNLAVDFMSIGQSLRRNAHIQSIVIAYNKSSSMQSNEYEMRGGDMEAFDGGESHRGLDMRTPRVEQASWAAQ